MSARSGVLAIDLIRGLPTARSCQKILDKIYIIHTRGAFIFALFILSSFSYNQNVFMNHRSIVQLHHIVPKFRNSAHMQPWRYGNKIY